MVLIFIHRPTGRYVFWISLAIIYQYELFFFATNHKCQPLFTFIFLIFDFIQ
jgi:hypothetical protein